MTVIIAMVVVVYVDQRSGVKEMPLPWRAFTAVSLSGIFAVGILNPLLVLGGFVVDTRGLREFTVIYTWRSRWQPAG